MGLNHDVELIKEFHQVEQQLYSVALKEAGQPSELVREPFILIEDQQTCAQPVAAHSYLFTVWIANAGMGELNFNLNPTHIIKNHQIVWGRSPIPPDGQYHPILIYAQLSRALVKGMTLFTVESNAGNKPKKELVYRQNTADQLVPVAQDGIFYVPLIPGDMNGPLRFSVHLPALPFLGDYDIDLPGVQKSEVIVRGKNETDSKASLWGRKDSTNGKANFTMGFADGATMYYFQVDKTSFPDPERGSAIRIENNVPYSVIQLKRYQIEFYMLNCFKGNIKLLISSNSKWLEIPTDPIAIESNQMFQIIIKIKREIMAPGSNQAIIKVKDAAKKADLATIELQVELSQYKSAIIIKNPLNSENVVLENKIWGSLVRFPLNVTCYGKRKHFILVTNVMDGNYEILQVENSSAEAKDLTVFAQVKTSALPPAQNHLPLLIDSGCYLANKRFIESEIRLNNSIFLKCYPRYLHFYFRREDDEFKSLYFQRSDLDQVNIELSASEELQPFLVLRQYAAHVWQVKLNNQIDAVPDKPILSELIFTDTKSSVTHFLPVRIDFFKTEV